MTLQNLQNLQIFMRRVTTTGEEAIAWCMAWQELNSAIEAAKSPPEAPAQPPIVLS